MHGNPTAEISGYLQHQDYSLALRRLLDVCFDTGDAHLTDAAIALSRQYREWIREERPTDAQALLQEEGRRLLEKAATLIPAPQAPRLLIDVQAIAKTYSSGQFTLQPVSLSIHTGDIWGLVGENGQGKTTLLRCLAGQLLLDKGLIRYSGQESPSFYQIKQTVAFIPQRIPRWYGALRENLLFSASLAGIQGAENCRVVDFFIERLGLGPYAHLGWNQISSGYRTRFELARVLLQRPQLLILDEPLANLDINAQQTILTDLRALCKSLRHPMGVILSSQQLHEVEKIADQVLFIRQGQCLVQDRGRPAPAATHLLELETSADRDTLIQVLAAGDVTVQYNGGFYTISSAKLEVAAMLALLVGAGIRLTYFRDITYSTKRFFN